MARIFPESKATALLNVIGSFPDGASLPDITGKLKPTYPKRTVQYLLSELVVQGRLTTRGQYRFTRYLVAPNARTKNDTLPSQTPPPSAPIAAPNPTKNVTAPTPHVAGLAQRPADTTKSPASAPAKPPNPPADASDSTPTAVRYQVHFQRLIPKMVQDRNSKFPAEVMLSQYAKYAFPTPAEQQDFLKEIMAELDALAPGNLAEYNLTEPQYTTWRKGWR